MRGGVGAVLAALALSGAAQAAEAGYHSSPMAAQRGEELAVTLENRCSGPASLQVVFRSGGAVLTTETRTVAAGQSATVSLRPQDGQTVRATMRVACPGPGAPQARLSIVLRDPRTQAPRYAGEVQEGTGI